MSTDERDTGTPASDDLVEELVAAYQREVWSVIRLEGPEILDELRTLAGRITAALTPAIREHRLLTDTELGVVRRLDALPFAGRLPRHDLVRLHHVAPKVLHRRIADAPPTEATDAHARIEHYRRTSATVLSITSQIRTSFFESTLPPSSTDPGDRSPEPQASVLAELVSGRTEAPETMRQRAQQVAGFVLGPAHVVASVETGGGHEVLRSMVQTTLEALSAGPYRPLGDLHHGRGVLILPVTDPAERTSLPFVLEEILDEAGVTEPVRAGIGRGQPELPGIRASYEQSLQVLGLLREAPILGPTMAFDDALPYLALHADPTLSLEIQSVVESLVVYDQAEGTELVRTLEAVLRNPGNLTEVSRTLHVHRHTLYNRIERIEELTGRCLSEADDRLLLELAVRASRLLP